MRPLGATGNAHPLLKIDLAFVSSDRKKCDDVFREGSRVNHANCACNRFWALP